MRARPSQPGLRLVERRERHDAVADGQPRRMLDTSRALAAFGWKARIGFEEGLAETVKWYEENRGSIIGAVDLLQKPILREDLQRVIGKQLRPRVLVVEDNHSDQCIFANGLAAEGIEFRVANSGRDALLVLDQFNPDVVLLDLRFRAMLF